MKPSLSLIKWPTPLSALSNPSLLHIEENQIYKGVERHVVEELDEEKDDMNKDPKAEKPIDKYVDLNIYENEFI